MARKKQPVAIESVKLDSAAKEAIHEALSYAESFPEGSPERRMAGYYATAVEADERYEAWLNLTWPLDMELTDKNRLAFRKALDEKTKRVNMVMSTLYGLEHLLKHTVTAPPEDVTMIIHDSLMGNADLVPSTEHIAGLERHRVVKEIAADLMSVFQEHRIKVREDESIGSPPLCQDCAA